MITSRRVASLTSTVRSVFGDDGPVVQLPGGRVRGLVEVVDSSHKVHFFQGIKYGHGKRFQLPKPVPAWSGITNATKWRDACPQAGIVKSPPGVPAFQTDTMSEDCLYLNVWSPVSSTKNRSVMVFIHGGGFTVGTIFNRLVDGKYLAASGDVVVVAMNYRLGAFGYLYGGTAETPGNIGYHDQILALKWVQSNIGPFGGNAADVTLFGESAGSWAVGELILSPLAHGLFSKAIMQSGGPNSLTGGIPKSRSLESTKRLASHLGCPAASTNTAIVKCIQAAPMEALVNYTVLDYNATDRFFLPVYGDSLAPLAPVEALKRGTFNRNLKALMYGTTRDEGTMFALGIFPHYATVTNLTVESVKKDIIHVAQLYQQTFGEEVAEYYTKNLHNPTQEELKLATSRSFGDCHLVCPTYLFGEQLVHYSPGTSFYSYRLTQHLGIAGLPYFPWIGVQHTDDLMYLFGVFLQSKPSDKALGSEMIHAWTNFAKTGNPGVSAWTQALDKSVPAPKTSFFTLNHTDAKMVNGYFTDICSGFWKPKIVQ